MVGWYTASGKNTATRQLSKKDTTMKIKEKFKVVVSNTVSVYSRVGRSDVEFQFDEEDDARLCLKLLRMAKQCSNGSLKINLVAFANEVVL